MDVEKELVLTYDTKRGIGVVRMNPTLDIPYLLGVIKLSTNIVNYLTLEEDVRFDSKQSILQQDLNSIGCDIDFIFKDFIVSLGLENCVVIDPRLLTEDQSVYLDLNWMLEKLEEFNSYLEEL